MMHGLSRSPWKAISLGIFFFSLLPVCGGKRGKGELLERDTLHLVFTITRMSTVTVSLFPLSWDLGSEVI